MNRLRNLILFSIALLLGGVGCWGWEKGRTMNQSAGAVAVDVPVGSRAGLRAPDVTLQEVRTGEEISLSQYLGRPVLVNFWATWCGPCRLEMPHLQAAYEAYQDEGFVVLAIDTKFDEEPPVVLAFLDELGLTFPVVKDVTGDVEIKKYNVIGLPTSVFIDRHGVIQYVHRGPMTKEFIEEKLKIIF